MRIGIASLSHESNTFATIPTVLDDFQVHRGQDLIDHYRSTFHEVSGFIAGADEYDYKLHPLVAASATPAGPVTSEAYEQLVGEIMDGIRQAPQLDGLLLALHGAMVAEHFPHADGETVRRVRQMLGPGFPIIVVHDYHANVPEQLVQDATALIIYKTNPHIDQRERGLQAAELVARTVRGDVQPESSIVKPDVLFNIVFHNTDQPPMQPLMPAAIELEKQPDVLACSIAAGYQYADVPFMGPSIVVVTDGNASLARQEAERLGQMMWERREQLIPDVPGPADAVRQAIASEQVPVALFELGDNIGGGSAGDSTFILQELLRQKASGWVVTLYDPESVQDCIEAGIGGRLLLQVGGKTDDMHGQTLAISGQVRTLNDGRYHETERRHGGRLDFDQGLIVVVEVQDDESTGLLVLNSRRTSPNSLYQIASVGIEPRHQRILVAKGAVAPRAAYEPICASIIEVDTGGATAINRAPREYEQARTSLYELSEHRAGLS